MPRRYLFATSHALAGEWAPPAHRLQPSAWSQKAQCPLPASPCSEWTTRPRASETGLPRARLTLPSPREPSAWPQPSISGDLVVGGAVTSPHRGSQLVAVLHATPASSHTEVIGRAPRVRSGGTPAHGVGEGRGGRAHAATGAGPADGRGGPSGPRPAPRNTWSHRERAQRVALAAGPEFGHASPHQRVPRLAARGESRAAESSVDRVLKTHALLAQRGRATPAHWARPRA